MYVANYVKINKGVGMIKILMVDDSMTSRMLFRMHLPEEGHYELHEASTVTGALEKAKEVQPDLIVIDYNMPEKNGVEVAAALRQAGVGDNCVLLTANTQQSVLDAARAVGIRQVFSKPVTHDLIRAILEK